jgi:hypothetical protein
MNEIKVKPDKENLSSLERVAEVIIILAMLLLLSFFWYHQSARTGFFTAAFGGLEMLALYGPLALGISAPAIRAWTGQRNPARPFEALTSLALSLGSMWLLIVFPLNYAHLADALPSGMRFVLAWVTDDIARVILLLQVLVGPITALLTMWRYVRRHESEAVLKHRVL